MKVYKTHTKKQEAFLKLEVSNPAIEFEKYNEKIQEIGIDGLKEKSLPNPISFDKLHNPSMQIRFSTSDQLNNIPYTNDNTSELNIYNLLQGQDYYYQLKLNDNSESEIQVLKTDNLFPRLIYVDGVTNFRDLGGIKTLSNKVSKQGLLYRSGCLNDITNIGILEFKKLGIKTEIELRSKRVDGESFVLQCVLKNNGAIPSLNFINLPMKDRCDEDPSILKDFFKTLSKSSNYPIVFHCLSGADRTGFLSFLIDCLLGYPLDYIIKDYVFSSFSYCQLRHSNVIIEYVKKLLYHDENPKINEKELQDLTYQHLIKLGVDKSDLDAFIKIMLD